MTCQKSDFSEVFANALFRGPEAAARSVQAKVMEIAQTGHPVSRVFGQVVEGLGVCRLGDQRGLALDALELAKKRLGITRDASPCPNLEIPNNHVCFGADGPPRS